MKKRFVVFCLAMFMACISVLPAYAAKGFDNSVLENGQDIVVYKDDMSGIETFRVKGMMENKKIEDSPFGTVTVEAMVSSNSEMEIYNILFSYYADNWAFIDEIVFKIGQKRYVFSNLYFDRKILRDATIKETLSLTIDDEKSIQFMEDLMAHRDEAITVRLDGTAHNIDFELPKEVKDGMIHLYNLYVQAGGTRKENWRNPGTGSSMRVENIS